MTARVLMLLKSCASLTCFQACFLPGQAKDLSAPWYYVIFLHSYLLQISDTCSGILADPIILNAL